jgi:hypothetical protein
MFGLPPSMPVGPLQVPLPFCQWAYRLFLGPSATTVARPVDGLMPIAGAE